MIGAFAVTVPATDLDRPAAGINDAGATHTHALGLVERMALAATATFATDFATRTAAILVAGVTILEQPHARPAAIEPQFQILRRRRRQRDTRNSNADAAAVVRISFLIPVSLNSD